LGFLAEAGDELVAGELVGELARAGERQRGGGLPSQLGPLEAELGGDDVVA
jgi:hypothetical protein